MASASTFKIVVRGRGSHAALPHLGLDPMPVACQIVSALQTVITRNKRPLDAAVLSVTMIHGGEASNVVPEHCTIQGTVRTFRIDVLDLIERRMRAIAEHTCAAFEVGCDFEFTRRAPPVVNHEREALFAAEVMRGIVGEAQARVQEPQMPSEDFAYMRQARPGAYAFIGNGEGDHRAPGHGEGPCMLHNPSYDFNDALLPLGATYWVRLAEAWLAAPPAASAGAIAANTPRR